MSAAVPRDDDAGPGLEPEPAPAPAPVLRDAAAGGARSRPNGTAATRPAARANAGGPPASLSALMDALRCLPGVGPKAAQRMAYHLLQYDRSGAETLAGALGNALEAVVRCARCNTFTETEVCGVCASPRRDPALLCVVETPSDLLMMEQTLAYNGMYFVLMGRLSPLDGIGPRDIGLDVLARRATDGTVREVVVATNFTNEGEATAHYIGEMLRDRGVKVSRIARGIPVGGELEYVDIGTIAQAMVERRPV